MKHITVEEYIKMLQEFDPKSIMIQQSSNPELQQAMIALDKPTQSRGRVIKKQCRDMMDNTSFETSVFRVDWGNNQASAHPIPVVYV